MHERLPKIEVYLTEAEKKEVKIRAKEYGISASAYLKLKALDKLK